MARKLVPSSSVSQVTVSQAPRVASVLALQENKPEAPPAIPSRAEQVGVGVLGGRGVGGTCVGG